MRLYTFQYVNHKDGYTQVVVPAYSEQCAREKVKGKNVVMGEDELPVIVKIDNRELNKDWK